MRTIWKLAASAALTTIGFGAAPALAQSYPADPYYDRYDGIDPTDPRFGRAIGEAMAAMTGVFARAMADAERSIRLPHDGYAGHAIDDEEQAVDACAVAAQREATRIARIASVEDIVEVDRADDGWVIVGTVETRDDWRDDQRDERRFTCSVRHGRVENVEIEDAFAQYGY